MELLIKQRVFSWIHVYDTQTGRELGSIHQRLLTFLPAFEVVLNGRTVGSVRKRFSLLFPRYDVDYRDWSVEGDLLNWDYEVTRGSETVMTISKELLHWGDTYTLRYQNPADELPGLLLVIAIDAANCKG